MDLNIWEKILIILHLMCVIIGFLVLAQIVVSAPILNPYDNYDLIAYNCLDIALETQEWYALNNINTTVFIGCFNESLCHAWLEDEEGNPITGYVPEWEFQYIYIWDRR